MPGCRPIDADLLMPSFNWYQVRLMPDPIDAGLIHALKKMTILFPFFGRKNCERSEQSTEGLAQAAEGEM